MQADPIAELRRLTDHYRELSDDELRDLAADFADLTETAQQALRTEMQSRGLSLAAANSLVATNAARGIKCAARPACYIRNQRAHSKSNRQCQQFLRAPAPTRSRHARTPTAEPDGPVDYTWKTPLCDCDTSLQARELSAALKQAGIESWIEAPGTGSRQASFDTRASVSPVRASLSPPISSIRRAPSPRSPFRDRSSKMRRQKFPTTSRPHVPNAAHRIPFSKASIPRTPGDASNAASAG